MMEKITIELYSKNDNYKEIIGFYKFFLNYVKPAKMSIIASFTNKDYNKKFNEKKFFEEISDEKYNGKYHTIFIKGRSLLDPSIAYNPNRMYVSM